MAARTQRGISKISREDQENETQEDISCDHTTKPVMEPLSAFLVTRTGARASNQRFWGREPTYWDGWCSYLVPSTAMTRWQLVNHPVVGSTPPLRLIYPTVSSVHSTSVLSQGPAQLKQQWRKPLHSTSSQLSTQQSSCGTTPARTDGVYDRAVEMVDTVGRSALLWDDVPSLSCATISTSYSE